MMRKIISVILVRLWLAVLLVSPAYCGTLKQIEYLGRDEFLSQAFPDDVPSFKFLRLNRALKNDIQSILGHRYPSMRIRYWQKEQRTAWIIDEIGKELPITMGVVIDGTTIDDIRIMVFREERGEEVHQRFFTEQFNQVGLMPDLSLDKDIDGITGATLSVEAVIRVARLTLWLNQYLNNEKAKDNKSVAVISQH